MKGSILLAAGFATLAGFTPHSAAAQTPLLPPAPPSQPGQLTPPPVLAPTPQASTEQQLNLAEQKDSKRGLQFVLLHADVGGAWSSLSALSGDDLLGSDVDDAGFGLGLGGGLGLRLLYLTAGARFRYAMLGSYDLWSVGLEGTLRIPKGAFEPYVLIGVGFSQAGSFQRSGAASAASADLSGVTASGGHARLGGGFDYFLTPVFSVGFRLDAEALYLTRDSIAGAPMGSLYADSGSAWGLSASGLASLGLHF